MLAMNEPGSEVGKITRHTLKKVCIPNLNTPFHSGLQSLCSFLNVSVIRWQASGHTKRPAALPLCWLCGSHLHLFPVTATAIVRRAVTPAAAAFKLLLWGDSSLKGVRPRKPHT
jgi:hypothetical protein